MIDEQYANKRSGQERRSGWDRIDASAKRLMLLLGVAAAVGSGMTKLADALIFGLVTPQRFKTSVEERFIKLERDIDFTRQLDSLRMVNHVIEITPFVDSVRYFVRLAETGTFLECLQASEIQRREFALARIDCEEIANRFGVRLK